MMPHTLANDWYVDKSSFSYFLQSDISDFLECVHLDEYLPVLKAEGYLLAEDVENMIGLSKEDLRKIGVTKRGW